MRGNGAGKMDKRCAGRLFVRTLRSFPCYNPSMAIAPHSRLCVDSPLTQLRLRRGLTQDDLAKMIGASRRTVIRYESGQHAPTRRKIALLAAALRVSRSTL